MNDDRCESSPVRQMEGFKGTIDGHELKDFVGHLLTNKVDMAPFLAGAVKGLAASQSLESVGQLPKIELRP